MEQSKNRILYLDFTKFFAIFCVVWGHSIQYLQTHDFFHNPIFEFIYSFHMPLFMSISGFFALNSLKAPFIQLITKKSRELLLPCITWGILTTCTIWILKGIFKNEMPSIHLLSGNLMGNLWFLKSLFLCYIVAFVSLKMMPNDKIAALISISFFIILPQFSYLYHLSFMLPFFWAGFFIKKYLVKIEKKATILLYISGLFFITMLFFWDGYYTIYCTSFKLPTNVFFSFNKDFAYIIAIACFRFSIGLCGTIFFILLFRKICQKHKNNKFIDYTSSHYGKYTMGIYILQSFILEYHRYPSMNFNGYDWLYNWITTPLYTMMIIMLSTFIIKVIEKNKYLNFFLLGKKLS